jgi:hypothetical protein
MLSSPAATGSKGERLALGRRPIGCETQPDLVSRARVKQRNKRRHRRAVFTEPAFWNPSARLTVSCQATESDPPWPAHAVDSRASSTVARSLAAVAAVQLDAA